MEIKLSVWLLYLAAFLLSIDKRSVRFQKMLVCTCFFLVSLDLFLSGVRLFYDAYFIYAFNCLFWLLIGLVNLNPTFVDKYGQVNQILISSVCVAAILSNIFSFIEYELLYHNIVDYVEGETVFYKGISSSVVLGCHLFLIIALFIRDRRYGFRRNSRKHIFGSSNSNIVDHRDHPIL